MTNPKKERRVRIIEIIAKNPSMSIRSVHRQLEEEGFDRSFEQVRQDFLALGLTRAWVVNDNLSLTNLATSDEG